MTATPQEDTSTIGTLIAKAAYLTDEGPLDDFALAFTQDAELVAGAFTQQGLATIQAWVAERRAEKALGPGSGLRHLVTPMSIEVAGDRASAVTYLQMLSTTPPSPTVVYFAIYDDEFVRSPDGWRIRRRCMRTA